MFRRFFITFLLSLLILFGFFTSSVRAVTVVIEPPTLLTIDGIPVTATIARTTNRKPTFVGRCNLSFALIDFEVRAPSVLGVSNADKNGVWKWTVPQQLDYGLHTLYVTATNPNDSTDTETNIFRVEITRSGVTTVRLGLTWLLGVTILAVVVFIAYKRLRKRFRKD